MFKSNVFKFPYDYDIIILLDLILFSQDAASYVHLFLRNRLSSKTFIPEQQSLVHRAPYVSHPLQGET